MMAKNTALKIIMNMKENNKDIIIYQTEDGEVSFNVNVFEETVWLTQKQMGELFDKDRKTITRHISNIFKDKELIKNSVCSFFEHTASDGKSYKTQYYNLDMIISVGYRVKSNRGIQFRQWATKVLKQYMINGYALNEIRVKKIESCLDELVESNKILKEDVSQIQNTLLKLIERPIVVQSKIENHINLTSGKLEEKLISFLDSLIDKTGEKEAKSTLLEMKKDVEQIQDKKSKNRLLGFLQSLGDKDSKLSKILRGSKISKESILSLAEKLKELFSNL